MAASGTVGSLLIEMGVDLARLRKDIAEAKATVGGAVKEIQSQTKQAAAALGIGLSAAGFAAWIKGSIDAQAQMGKWAQRAGEGIETLSALSFAFRKAGDVDAPTLGTAIKALDKEIAGAAAGGKEQQGVFKALGIEYLDTAGKARRASGVLLDLADVFKGAENDPTKTAYALKLLGKAGDDMIPGLNRGREELERLMQQARDTGKVISEEAAEQAQRFNDSLDDLKDTGTDLGRAIANDLLPRMNAITKEMIEARKESGLLGMLWAGNKRYWYEVFGGMDDPVQRAGKAVVDLTDDVSNLEKTLAGMSSSVNPGVKKRLTDEIARKKAELDDAIKWFQLLEKNAAAEPKPEAGGSKVRLDPKGLKNNDQALAEEKRFISALQSLEKEYAGLTNEGRVAVLQWETEKGSLRELTAEHKAELLAKAELIDGYRREQEAIKMVVAGLEAESAARTKALGIADDLASANRDERDEMQFQLSTIGASAREMEKLAAVRAIDLRLRQQVAQLPMDEEGNFLAGSAQAFSRMQREAEQQRALILGMIDERQQAERSFVVGAKQAFDEYVDAATNSAQQARDVFETATRGMEDTFVEFVRTGKLSFSSLADSIIADMARIAVRRSIAGLMTGGGGLDGLLASLGGATNNFGAGFGSGAIEGGVGAQPYATGTDFVPREGLYHLHRGEKVVNAAENRPSAEGGVTHNHFTFHIVTNDANSFRTSTRQIAADVRRRLSR